MRLKDEDNIEILRQKAMLLEQENVRLQRNYQKALRENLELKQMPLEDIEKNLPGLLEHTLKGKEQGSSTGSERRVGVDKKPQKKKKEQKGHGPTEQKKLPVEECLFDLDEADKACTLCGGELDEWKGAEDKIEVVDIVERQFVIKQCRLKKYRCKCGGSIETADGPQKLISGGRYSHNVAIATATAKYLDHIPLARQVKVAKRQGLDVKSQTLWDQLWALAVLLAPLCERIHAHILEQPVIGTDLTGFKLIGKGGSQKQQVWQQSCPTGIYFNIKGSKEASVGEALFMKVDGSAFNGVVVADGAAELSAIANRLGFPIAACLSHVRRAVLKAEGEAPAQVAEFLEFIRRLYDVDKEAIGPPLEEDTRMGYRHRLDLDKLRVLRDEKSRAICSEMQTWILEQSCIPGGQLKKSLTYVARRWTSMLRFLDDPNIPLDNNLTERHFIGLAIGRRNYIGARSARGLIAAARFYTVVESARVCGVDGEAYLRYVVGEALSGRVASLPHEWSASHR